MKKVVCGIFGTIYYATILKNGIMSDKGRVEVTKDAVDAVFNHLMTQEDFHNDGLSGYISKKSEEDGGGEIMLCTIDLNKYGIYEKDKYSLVEKGKIEND